MAVRPEGSGLNVATGDGQAGVGQGRTSVEAGYTAVTDVLRELRPPAQPGFEVRFKTPPGEQAQVDLARFEVVFMDEPGVIRIVWLFSMVLGFSRLIWARFVVHQDLQTILRCHIAVLEAIGGAPRRRMAQATAPSSTLPRAVGLQCEARAFRHNLGATNCRAGTRRQLPVCKVGQNPLGPAAKIFAAV